MRKRATAPQGDTMTDEQVQKLIEVSKSRGAIIKEIEDYLDSIGVKQRVNGATIPLVERVKLLGEIMLAAERAIQEPQP